MICIILQIFVLTVNQPVLCLRLAFALSKVAKIVLLHNLRLALSPNTNDFAYANTNEMFEKLI